MQLILILNLVTQKKFEHVAIACKLLTAQLDRIQTGTIPQTIAGTSANSAALATAITTTTIASACKLLAAQLDCLQAGTITITIPAAPASTTTTVTTAATTVTTTITIACHDGHCQQKSSSSHEYHFPNLVSFLHCYHLVCLAVTGRTAHLFAARSIRRFCCRAISSTWTEQKGY